MIKNVFYNGSFPRAGSTLMQNILGQNPDIHVTPTSGIFELMYNSRTTYTNGLEFKAQDEDEMRKGMQGFLKGAIYGFYDNITDKPYVVDKCRGWLNEFGFINEYEENPKVICMVRDLRAIFSSLEKKYRKNPHLEHNIANWGTLTGTTPDKRVVHWSNNVPLGPSLDRLYQCIIDGTHSNILFVRYEDLCVQPDIEMQRVYNYLELDQFTHNFRNIEQTTHEDDKIYGVFGDHVIKNELKPVKNDFVEILGQNACKIITDGYPWYFEAFNYDI